MSIAKRLHDKYGTREDKLTKDELSILKEFRSWESPSDAFKLSADPPPKEAREETMIYEEEDIIEYADMVRSIRQGMGMERKEFAEFLNVKPRTIELWESYTSKYKTTKGPTYQRILQLKNEVDKGVRQNPNPHKVVLREAGRPSRPVKVTKR